MENRTCFYCHMSVQGFPLFFQVGEAAVPICTACDDQYVTMSFDEREE